MDPVEKQERELEELLRKGDLGRAALLARTLGNALYAARLFAQAKMPYQAAVCFYEAGDSKASLDAFLRVDPTSPRFRNACVHVVRLGTELNTMSFAMAEFVAPFAATDPENREELQALHKLGILYQRHELFDHARAVFARVVRIAPHDADALQRLRTMEAVARNAPSVYQAIMQDASSFRPTRAQSEAPPPLRERASSPPAGDGESGLESTSEVLSSIDVVFVPTTLRSSESQLPSPSSEEPGLGGPELERGSMIASRYRVDKEIGRGGMGVVYRATDLELDEPIAIKIFSQELDEQGLQKRFKQELLLCRQLTHPNIIRLYDIGAHAGRKFISMELLSGKSLKQHLKEGVDLRRALSYLMQMCAGLDAAHAQGVIHRDVKPDNVFVTNEGVIKLMDFGLAKRHGEGENITESGFMAGSPGYMAPEQVTSFGAATHLADLYALGVVAYELVAGRRPFRHRDKTRVIELQLTTVPQPPSTYKKLPPELDEIIMRLVQKDPESRFQSAREVYDRLAPLFAAAKAKMPPPELPGR